MPTRRKLRIPRIQSIGLLSLRPAKLSRGSAQHVTEVPRQMTLIEKTNGERNLR
jgi:hypothetical protein